MAKTRSALLSIEARSFRQCRTSPWNRGGPHPATLSKLQRAAIENLPPPSRQIAGRPFLQIARYDRLRLVCVTRRLAAPPPEPHAPDSKCFRRYRDAATHNTGSVGLCGLFRRGFMYVYRTNLFPPRVFYGVRYVVGAPRGGLF